jgi:hypothetical protein
LWRSRLLRSEHSSGEIAVSSLILVRYADIYIKADYSGLVDS